MASDVRYKAKGKVKPGTSEEEKKKVFLQILGASPAPSSVKAMARQKLLGEGKVEDYRKAGNLSREAISVGSNTKKGQDIMKKVNKMTKKMNEGSAYGMTKGDGMSFPERLKMKAKKKKENESKVKKEDTVVLTKSPDEKKKKKKSKGVEGATDVPNFPQDQVSEGAAWTKKAGKNKEGGLNEKGRKSYERDNPGSDLKAPSKKKGNKRRASFCARMKGMKKKLTSKKTARDPDSRINKSLRAWNC